MRFIGFRNTVENSSKQTQNSIGGTRYRHRFKHLNDCLFGQAGGQVSEKVEETFDTEDCTKGRNDREAASSIQASRTRSPREPRGKRIRRPEATNTDVSSDLPSSFISC